MSQEFHSLEARAQLLDSETQIMLKVCTGCHGMQMDGDQPGEQMREHQNGFPERMMYGVSSDK